MSNDLVRPISAIPLAEIVDMAKYLTESKLFGIKNTQQAVALMLVAQAEGRHPATVAMEYHIIEGRPTLTANAMLARFISSGGRVQWHRLDNEIAEATFTATDNNSVRLAWTIEMARKAGLNHQNWTKYPRTMLRSRLVSEAYRTISGSLASTFYTPEEVQNSESQPGETSTGNGEVIDAEGYDEDPVEMPAAGSLPPYPSDQFRKHFPVWERYIEDGHKTAEDIVRFLEEKFTLNVHQLAQINNVHRGHSNENIK